MDTSVIAEVYDAGGISTSWGEGQDNIIMEEDIEAGPGVKAGVLTQQAVAQEQGRARRTLEKTKWGGPNAPDIATRRDPKAMALREQLTDKI